MRTSINHLNITLQAEEVLGNKSESYPMQFARPVSSIIGSSASIVYTDFILDIGPIESTLSELGVDAMGHHREMDASCRHESHIKWKSGQVQVIVATRAFGMGINKPDIRRD